MGAKSRYDDSQYDFQFPGSSAKSFRDSYSAKGQYDFPFPGSSAKSFRDSYSAKGQYDFPFPGSSAKSQYDFPFPGSSAKSRFGPAMGSSGVTEPPISVGWYLMSALTAAVQGKFAPVVDCRTIRKWRSLSELCAIDADLMTRVLFVKWILSLSRSPYRDAFFLFL